MWKCFSFESRLCLFIHGHFYDCYILLNLCLTTSPGEFMYVCRIQYLQSNFKYANYLNIYLQSWSEFHRWVPLSSDEKLKMWSIYDPKCFNLKKTVFHEKLMEFPLNNYSQRLKGDFKQWKNWPRINHQPY